MSESFKDDFSAFIPDVAGIAALGALLAALHFLVPPSIHDRLIFYHNDPTLLTMWTSAFFHQDIAHLQSNLQGYIIAIAPTYLLYSYWDRRRRFWITVALLLIVVPFVTAIVDYWLFSGWLEITESFNSQGFSGVASAFGGMLLASIGLFVADEYDRSMAFSTINAIVILAFGLLAFVSGILSPLLIGLIVVGTVLLGGQFISLEWVREPAQFARVIRENRDPILVVVYGGLAVCWLIPAIFPVDVVQGGTLTNIFAHGVGFGVGVVATVVQFFVANRQRRVAVQ